MAYRFLRKGYDALVAKIQALASALREAGQEKGRWADQGAETWHDNFGYEEEQRQEWTLSDRLEDFARMKDDAEIVQGRAIDEVDVGAQVTVRDIGTGEQRTFVIGSYQVLDRQHRNEISCAAPFARPFMGARIGEERLVRDRRSADRLSRDRHRLDRHAPRSAVRPRTGRQICSTSPSPRFFG